MDEMNKDLVRLAHRLIVGYDPSPQVVDQLLARNDSLERLRGELWLHFDTRRQMEMLRFMDFLYRDREPREQEFEREMDMFLSLDPVIEGKVRAAIAREDDEYTRFHRLRFFDQVRALGAIRTKVFGQLDEIDVLDVGVMSVARTYADGIGGLRLHTTDHPRRGAENLKYGSADFYPADLETEELSVLYPELVGKFHAIIFCEVLEHLKLSPHEILRDFKRLLAPGGMIYLTTPNGMAYGAFLAYFEGNSPVVEYSRQNKAAHLENFVHVREYTPKEMAAGFENAGLRIRYRAIKEYYNPASLWVNAFVGARSLLTYIVDAA